MQQLFAIYFSNKLKLALFQQNKKKAYRWP